MLIIENCIEIHSPEYLSPLGSGLQWRCFRLQDKIYPDALHTTGMQVKDVGGRMAAWGIKEDEEGAGFVVDYICFITLDDSRLCK